MNFIFILSKSLILLFNMQNILLILCFLMWGLILISYSKVFFKENKFFNIINFTLIMVSIFFFLSNSFILFFLVFEIRLISIIIFILRWGYQYEKLQSSFYLFLYITVFRIPFLFSLIKIYNQNYLNFLSCIRNINFYSTFFIILLLNVFFVKTPFYFFHLWLPKAHVESIVIGSILLSTIILKIGVFGLIRFISFIKFFSSKFLYLINIIMLLGLMISLFIIINQNDQKILIAYSSIFHIIMIGVSIFFFNNYSLIGRKLIMLTHGFISNLIFFKRGLFYNLIFSRIIFNIQSIINLNKILGLRFFLIIIINFSAPPFLRFFSEVFLLKSILFNNINFIIVFLFIIIISCFYNLNFFNQIWYGKVSINLNLNNLFLFKEIFFSFFFLIPLILFLINFIFFI